MAGDVRGLADCLRQNALTLASRSTRGCSKGLSAFSLPDEVTFICKWNLDTFKLQNGWTGSCKHTHKNTHLKLSSSYCVIFCAQKKIWIAASWLSTSAGIMSHPEKMWRKLIKFISVIYGYMNRNNETCFWLTTLVCQFDRNNSLCVFTHLVLILTKHKVVGRQFFICVCCCEQATHLKSSRPHLDSSRFPTCKLGPTGVQTRYCKWPDNHLKNCTILVSTYLPVYLPTDLPTYLPTYLYICIHP